MVNGPNVPGLKFSIKATEETQNGQPARLNVQATYANGQSRTLYQIPVYAFTSGMAVDYNRDGEIHFHDEPGNPKAGTDDVPGGQYYEFWVNDDHDEEGTDGALDDKADNVRDCDKKEMRSLRGLEDYARLRVKMPSSIAAGGQRLTYALRLDGSSAQGAPSIQLFRATDTDGGLGYLRDVAAGQAQLSTDQDSHYAGDVLTATRGQWLFADPAGTNGHFIFDAASAGSAPLVLVIQQGGLTVARYQLPMHLRPITDFYEEWTVGDLWPQEPAITATQVRALSVPNASPEYILFVHGFNMPVWARHRWAETAYKRLWWLGYKGTLGLFSWPCALGDLQYDHSEENAWKSGRGLEDCLLKLRAEGRDAHVIAHSQGNVVMAQALRGAKDDTTFSGYLAKGYLASQAAITASAFDSNAPWYKVNHLTGSYDNPDVHGHYPDGRADEPPYMLGTGSLCGKLVNFYNPLDCAVGDIGLPPYWWEWDNTLKPDSGYRYNSVDLSFESVRTVCDNTDPDHPKCHEETTPLTPGVLEDRFRIFSYAAESYGVTVGATGVPWFQENHSLQAEFGFGGSRADHSGQFLYGIQRQWGYWDSALESLGLSYKTWKAP